MYIPTTVEEVNALGWNALDIILVTGDSYIDSPLVGVSVIGKCLIHEGYRVGIIAQPDINSREDIMRLGEPRLFWGVTGGCVDSMVANYTASGKKRKNDDYTPGGANNRRPDRAVIVYANLIRTYFKQTVPIVLGGIEASLRRTAHFDFWSKRIRRSILVDAKADYLLYGMADRSVVDLAACLKNNHAPLSIPGLCYMAATPPENALALPDVETVSRDKAAFTRMFHLFYQNTDPVTACHLCQKQDNRYLVQNPPPPVLSGAQLDDVHALSFERDLHPYYGKKGTVRALDTIRFSLVTHRGCYGECNFCAISLHQGRTITCRSQASILDEARIIASHPLFRGTLSDVGGPTANMYGIECSKKKEKGRCSDRRCLYPVVCPSLKVDHSPQIRLLSALMEIPGIRHVFVASGIRHDMILADKKHGQAYLDALVSHHVSGQLKIAPEHSDPGVLEKMGKPPAADLIDFKRRFERTKARAGLKCFLTYYLMAAHPGCTVRDMSRLRTFARHHLQLIPKQIQVFTPTPSTYATLMYHTERNPFSGSPIFVEKSFKGRERQKAVMFEPSRRKKTVPDAIEPTQKQRRSTGGNRAKRRTPNRHRKH